MSSACRDFLKRLGLPGTTATFCQHFGSEYYSFDQGAF